MCGSTSRIWHALEVENISFDVLKMVVCRVPRQRPAGRALTLVQHFGGRPVAVFTFARLIRATLFRASLS